MFSIYSGVVFAVLFTQTQPPDIDQFFDRFEGERSGMESFIADFDQETISPDETANSKGQLIYVRPRRIRFRYADNSLDFLLHGLRIYEYDAEFEQLDITDLEDRPGTEALYMSFESNLTRLREAYDIQLKARSDGEPGIELKLTPKVEDDEEPLFLNVMLTLRADDFLPVHIAIQNDEESSVRYTLTNHQINPELAEDDLTIFLPEDTVVAENGAYIETVGEDGKRVPEFIEALSEEPANPEPAVQTEDLR